MLWPSVGTGQLASSPRLTGAKGGPPSGWREAGVREAPAPPDPSEFVGLVQNSRAAPAASPHDP
jgi:hypothetical protein